MLVAASRGRMHFGVWTCFSQSRQRKGQIYFPSSFALNISLLQTPYIFLLLVGLLLALNGSAKPAAAQVALAALILLVVAVGAGIHASRRALQPGFVAVGTTPVSAPAFVVVQVLVLGIPLGDAVDAVGFVDVPTHEVDRVGKVGPAGSAVAGFLPVVIPG